MGSAASKHEGWLYGLAFLVALGLRLVQLDSMPLADAEALPALQALGTAQGLAPVLSPQAAYIQLTAVLFYFLGSTDFLARFVPALTGSVLVLVPLLFRPWLKPRPAVILACFLAIDPGLVAVSRQAASSILAITFVLFAIAYLVRQQPIPAGIFAGLALLSGPSLWGGLLGLAITAAIWRSAAMRALPREHGRRLSPRAKAARKQAVTPTVPTPPTMEVSTETLRGAVPFLLGTFLLVGTLFLFAPGGLSAAFASLPAYLRGWGTGGGVPMGRLFASLLIYQPLAIILAVLALVRGFRHGSRRILLLGLWLVCALFVAVLPASRQVTDLGWTLVPLWCLAAIGLAPYTRVPRPARFEAAAVTLLTVVLLVFAWFDLAALRVTPAGSADATLRIGLLVGAFIFLALSLSLVAAGWSTFLAAVGGLSGVTSALLLYTLAAASGTAGLRGEAHPELWWLPDRPAHARLLEATVADLANWSTGDDAGLPVEIRDLVSPSLEWTLRFHAPSEATGADPAMLPALVITPLQSDARLEASYRGQDFTWRQNAAWSTANTPTWVGWLVTRQMPFNSDAIILWARTDLFPDARPSIPGS